jgi:acetylornithine deacetylase/succinyl-diaminopimelate desuccinylase-like protein
MTAKAAISPRAGRQNSIGQQANDPSLCPAGAYRRQAAEQLRRAQQDNYMHCHRNTGKGGLYANWMVRHGVPAVTFGAGHNEPHAIDE